MTPAEITLVKTSFLKVVPFGQQAAALFYARLFELDPSLRPLFRGDMSEQGRRLMLLLAHAVAALEHPAELAVVVRQLDTRHLDDAIREEHSASVRAALLWTMEKVLGPYFTPAVKYAWANAYVQFTAALTHAPRTAPVTA